MRASRVGWMGIAVVCGVLGTAPLHAQSTVRVADLRPRQARISTQPLKRLLLPIDPQALARYGGLGGLQFRLMREPALTRSATAPRCVLVPTQSVRPRGLIASTGELDFGQPFTAKHLGVAGEEWKEATWYLVAEVAGMPGQELRVSTGDLRRYHLGGVALVLQPHGRPPTPADIREIQARLRSEAPRPAPDPCWRVSG